MGIFEKATIMNVGTIVNESEGPVAGAKISKQEMAEIDRMCEAEGLPSRSEFIREALTLRTTYTGEYYLKLVGYAEQIKLHLDTLTSPGR